MKAVGLVILILALEVFSMGVHAQLTINNTGYSVSGLVSNVLLPSGSATTVSNVVFQGVYNQSSRYQVGSFTTSTTTQTQMGFSGGVILTSGNTSEIPLTLGTDPRSTQVSRNYTSCTTGEVRKGGTCPTIINDLTTLAGSYNYYNTAVLEFDFVAAGTAVSFRYIFGSEEYEDNSGFINYQCSDYNDRFAFLLSGPGISGGQGYTNDAKNIARLSNGAIVSINGVNNGVVGSSGGSPAASKCLTANSSWTNGAATAEYLGTIDGTQMNGNTRVLTAYQSGLTPGSVYHIKLIIMDINDGAYDSVVYLEGGSFTTEASPLAVELDEFNGSCSGSTNALNWSTDSERNNSYFTLEKYDFDTQTFQFLTKVAGSGNTAQKKYYQYDDTEETSGISIYRLSETDYNGKTEELKTISVNNTCFTPKEFSAFFTKSGDLKFCYDGVEPQSVHLELLDEKGANLLEEDISAEAGQCEEFGLPFQLNNGIFFLKISTDHSTRTMKLVKVAGE